MKCNSFPRQRRRSRKTTKGKQETERCLDERERCLQERERYLQERERCLQEKERCLQERERCLLPSSDPGTSGCPGVSLKGLRLEKPLGRAETSGHVGLASAMEEGPNTPQDVGPSILPSSPPRQTTPPLSQNTPLPSQTTLPRDQTTPPVGQTTPQPGLTTPPLGQTTPQPGLTTPPLGQTAPQPGLTTPPLGHTTSQPDQPMLPLNQTTPQPDQMVPPPNQRAPTLNQTTPPPDQTTPTPALSSPPNPSKNQGDVSGLSTTPDLQVKRPSCQTCSAGQEPTNQSAGSLASTGPLSNPETGGEAARVTPNPSTSGRSGDESTPGPGREGSAKDAGKGANDQSRKCRKDVANSQQPVMEERKEGIMGRQTSETAQQQSLESAQGGPSEPEQEVEQEQVRSCPWHEQDSKNLFLFYCCIFPRLPHFISAIGQKSKRRESSKKNQRGEEAATSSEPTGSSVDAPENMQAPAGQSDDEGFQTATSKRKKKGLVHPPDMYVYHYGHLIHPIHLIHLIHPIHLIHLIFTRCNFKSPS